MPSAPEVVEIDGKSIQISNPDKVFFSARRETKGDLVRYYLAVGEAALRGVWRRPTVMKRYPDGAEGPHFFQKRVPEKRPDWLHTTTVHFPSGRHAEELCPTDVAHLIWAVNLGCIDLNPWAVRDDDLDHPDELRVDLDPQPTASFDDVRTVARMVREVLSGLQMVGFLKTSGSRGLHITVPVVAAHGFDEVRRAALALAREVESRLPGVATAKWWKEERGDAVFIDYNQNARDRTVASAYSARANPQAKVSCPITWDELDAVDPSDLTIATVPHRLVEIGDPARELDDRRYELEPLLELVARHERRGLGDAPWPPHYRKQDGEPARVAPSKRRQPTESPT